MSKYLVFVLPALFCCSGCGGGGGSDGTVSIEGTWAGQTLLTEATCDDSTLEPSASRDFVLEVSGPSGAEEKISVVDQSGRVYAGTGDSQVSEGFTVAAVDAGNYVLSFSDIAEQTAHLTFTYGYMSPNGESCRITFEGTVHKG